MENQKVQPFQTTQEQDSTMAETRRPSMPTATAATEKKTELHPRLLSFLEKDNSFLTPWSWDNSKAASTSTKEKEYIQFPPGSYFHTQVSLIH